MKTASEIFKNIREQSPGHMASEHGPNRKTRKGENVKSEHGPDAVDEQHAEEGRFKPVVPHNVKSTAGGRTRATSDSANVKLREDTMELNEGKMGQIHADIGEKLDKHIDDYKAHGGAEHLGSHTVKTAQHISKLHGIEQKHAQKFVNDYVETRLKEDVNESRKMTTQEKLDKNLKKGGYDSSATQDKLKKIDAALKAQREKYIAQGTLKEEEYWKKKGWQKKMSDAAKKQNRKKDDDVPFDPPYTTKPSATAGKYGSGYSTARHLARMAARKAAGIKEETLEEGRPSQRHPLEGHPYHSKSHAELIHIAKDAHAAAEAMKSHNTDAENKYRDQASDSATVRHWRKMNGTPEWYRKKYNLKEESNGCPVCGQTPCNCTHITEAWDQPDYNQSIQARQAQADKKSRKASIIRKAHETAKNKKKTQKEGTKDKFEADPELSSQIIRND